VGEEVFTHGKDIIKREVNGNGEQSARSMVQTSEMLHSQLHNARPHLNMGALMHTWSVSRAKRSALSSSPVPLATIARVASSMKFLPYVLETNGKDRDARRLHSMT